MPNAPLSAEKRVQDSLALSQCIAAVVRNYGTQHAIRRLQHEIEKLQEKERRSAESGS